eukprot:TRINITY_DN1929_c0_g1_i3.p1 TRINITY_DN1929_c0_g1~~TRINITY_DN1929_c0_g1_i3.p1  ORF type:complete len:106 (-),score=28.62 TRINITY_DN1929_c0_g1_i3:155-472(-)
MHILIQYTSIHFWFFLSLLFISCSFLSQLVVFCFSLFFFFFLMIRLPPRSTQSRSSAASDVYKRQTVLTSHIQQVNAYSLLVFKVLQAAAYVLSLIHISEPTRPY